MPHLPFQALQTLLTVARCQGIRPAAEVLNLSPSAVSRQVAALEAHLGVPLLERSLGGPVHLTDEGRELVQQTEAPMQQLVQRLRPGGGVAHGQRPVVINTSVTLAMHGLIPHLPALQKAKPGLQVFIQTDAGPARATLPVDVFIRRDPKELVPMEVQPWAEEQSVWVAAGAPAGMQPAVQQASPALLVQQMARWPRIAARSRPDLWPAWCQAHGVDESLLAPPIWFDHTVLAIQAVLQGLGSSVLPLMFVAPMLCHQQLQRLHPSAVTTGHCAFAIGPGRDSARVSWVVDWLRQLPSVAWGAGG